MKKFGLVGHSLAHSFSKRYFSEKFAKEKIQNCCYELYPLKDIQEFPGLLQSNKDIHGLNVTVPYKESIIPFLDNLDTTAEKVRSVNTIKIIDNYTSGYNTDIFGFTKSIKPLLSSYHNKTLILGTGGAAKAVAFGLRQLGIQYSFVSRTPDNNALSYEQLSKELIHEHLIIINTTPLGMGNKTDACPAIPYINITKKHLLFDLNYNPAETLFLRKGKEQNCIIKNGLDMLYAQAEKAWAIWNS